MTYSGSAFEICPLPENKGKKARVFKRFLERTVSDLVARIKTPNRFLHLHYDDVSGVLVIGADDVNGCHSVHALGPVRTTAPWSQFWNSLGHCLWAGGVIIFVNPLIIAFLWRNKMDPDYHPTYAMIQRL